MSPSDPVLVSRPRVAPPDWPDALDCIVLPPTSAIAAQAPEVRLFVGTQPAEQRAERALLWSILRCRDPSRSYSVCWLRELPGFRRVGWNTRFEGYGYSVPHLCGGRGRALYCTVDQVFLDDPAALFDADMAGHRWLAASANDPSLMLIDCSLAAKAWPIERVRTDSRRGCTPTAPTGPHAVESGPLPNGWDRPRSGVLRFDALHTQPWRPFPDRFVYQEHPWAEQWFELEREALGADFEVFERHRSSVRFSCRFGPDSREQAMALPRLIDPRSPSAELCTETAVHDVAIRESLRTTRDKRVSIYTLGRGNAWRSYCAQPSGTDPKLEQRWGADAVRVVDAVGAAPDAGDRAYIVVCTGTLERVPTEDLPWVLAELFGCAKRFVHLGIRPDPDTKRLREPRARPLRRTARWWIGQVEHAARRHPDIHWQIVLARGAHTEIRHGGRHLGDRPPTVWVLADDRPGNTSQSLGLAQALGWPYSIRRLHFSPAARLHNRLLGASRVGIRRRHSSRMAPPWPDLVIAAGRRSAAVAQWIRRRNFGRTRLVHLGRKGGDAADHFDLVVTPTYGRLDPHPLRVVTSAPLHRVLDRRVEDAAQRWSERLADAKRPRIAVLVGGWSGQYRLDPKTARALGEDVMRLADDVGGSILATTSRRTTNAGSEAFYSAIDRAAYAHRWSSTDRDNPYLAYLAFADVFVITGDSESMLSEAASRGRPIFIYRLPERASFEWMRAGRDWVYARAHAQGADPDAGAGAGETQSGLGYLCARLIDLGFVRPTRDLNALHEGLIREGAARRFGEPIDGPPCVPLGNKERVVERVCALMGHEALR